MLEALLATGLPIWVVTNAHTDLVDAKLDKLAPKGRERLQVKGDARKYLIEEPQPSDARFAALPETISFARAAATPRLPAARPVLRGAARHLERDRHRARVHAGGR